MFKYVRFVESENEFTKLTFLQKNDDVKIIGFDKPIVALECEDEAKIDELIAFQDEAIKCELITYDEFKAIVETTTQYARVLQRVELRLNELMSDIEKKYPLAERETWQVQKEEAVKFLETKDEADAPFLKVLADAENDTVENFATAVLYKNGAFTLMSANAIKEKRVYKTKLLAELGL